MNIDLHSLPLAELKQLQRDVGKAIQSYEDRKKAEALAEIDAVARDMGFVLHDLVGGKPPRKPVAAKYSDPADKSRTWSGRGRQPVWFREALAAGRKPDDLKV